MVLTIDQLPYHTQNFITSQQLEAGRLSTSFALGMRLLGWVPALTLYKKAGGLSTNLAQGAI